MGTLALGSFAAGPLTLGPVMVDTAMDMEMGSGAGTVAITVALAGFALVGVAATFAVRKLRSRREE